MLFDIIQMDNEEYEIEFSFENESLKHKLDNTMRTNMFQVGISETPYLVWPLLISTILIYVC